MTYRKKEVGKMKKVCIIVAIFGIALGMIGCAKPTITEEPIQSLPTPEPITEDVEETIESLEDVK
jgi:hypothetical protein